MKEVYGAKILIWRDQRDLIKNNSCISMDFLMSSEADQKSQEWGSGKEIKGCSRR